MTFSKQTPGAWRCVAGWTVLLLLVGCGEVSRLLWSPDGKHAVLLKGNEMYLCNPAGGLSGILLSDVTAAAWFGDSQRLLLVRAEVYTNWQALAVDLPAETADAVRKVSDVVLAKLQADTALDKLGEELRSEPEGLVDASVLYLRDQRPQEVRKALLNTTNTLAGATARLNRIQLAHLAGAGIELDATLTRDLRDLAGIRLSPDDRFIAYGAGSPAHLNLLAVDGREPVQEVDRLAGAAFDWSPDSCSLAYLRPEGSDPEQVLVGALARRRVVDEAGRVDLKEKAEDLAVLLNDSNGQLRWLRDGRIVFAATEIQLPAAAKDTPQRQQFFAVDPDRQATITPLVPRGSREALPENLSRFELSPDEKRIVVAGDKSKVVVFTLASGEVDVVQSDAATDLKLLPSWRGSNEVCYAALSEPDKQGKRKGEVMLWQAGRTNASVLSTHWPATVRTNWLD